MVSTMHMHSSRLLVVVLVMLAGTIVSADRVRLRSGKVVEGTFTGADSSTVRLLLANGSRAEFPVADVAGIDFTARTPPAASAAARPHLRARRRRSPCRQRRCVNVRLTEAIDVDATKAGAAFRALVDDPVMLDGKVVIPRSAAVVVQAVRVEQSGTIKGSDKISLKANSISFGGQTYEVVTAYVEAKGSGEGKKSARKIGGGVGLGAIVGGIAGGGTGRGDWCGGGGGRPAPWSPARVRST